MTHVFVFRRLLAAFSVLCALCFTPMAAQAQPAGADGDNFLYNVVSGDTLINLAQRYTDKPSNWTTLQSLNQVADPALLPLAKQLKIPFALIPEVPAPATVVHVKGQADANGTPVTLNSQVKEGDAVVTGANGFVTLELSDQSAISVPPNSRLTVERLRAFKGTGLVDAILDVRSGGLESEVAPEKTGVGRFEVRTPVSVTGVRGTRLRVRAQESGSQTEVIHGRALLATGNKQQAVLRQGQGAATSASGQFLGVRPLLPAPELSTAAQGGPGWVASFPPVPGAQSYLVQVAQDEAGTQLVSSKRFDQPSISYGANGSGTFYVRVRAIDRDGVMGEDAIQSFPGQPGLQTAFGLPVSTAFGSVIVLKDY